MDVQRLLRIYESLGPAVASSMWTLLKCFCFSTWAIRDLGLFSTLNNCLSSMVVLKASEFLKPNPPKALELPN